MGFSTTDWVAIFVFGAGALVGTLGKRLVRIIGLAVMPYRLVAELLKRSDRAIKCLVRRPKAQALSRLEARLRSFGISTGTIRHRVECIEANLADPTLGLTEKQYTSLANRATVLINCAAILDFVRPYMALRPINVDGARAMINLLAAGRPKRLFQISSISVLETPLKASQLLGEREPLDYPETLTTGYSQTKWVADVMVSHARSRGFSASIVRLPWLIDRTQDATPSDGFLLRLFKSALSSGACRKRLHVSISFQRNSLQRASRPSL